MRRAAKRVMLAPLLLLLQCAAVSGKNLVASVAGGLKAQGDTPIVAIACCGAGRATPSVVTSAVGAGTGAVSLVADAHTPLALLDAGADADADADSTSAVASCDVLALEVRFTDLVERTPHGLAQLGPLLQRSVKLRDLRPQPKLLLLTVTDYDKSEASEAAVTAFVAAELKAIVAGLALPEGADLSVADLLQLHCVFLPSASAAPDAYDAALARLREALLGTDDSPSLFDGRLSSPASAVVSCMGQAAERAPGVSLAAPPADVHAAYQCGLLAEAAAREFQKGASALRKAVRSRPPLPCSRPPLSRARCPPRRPRLTTHRLDDSLLGATVPIQCPPPASRIACVPCSGGCRLAERLWRACQHAGERGDQPIRCGLE